MSYYIVKIAVTTALVVLIAEISKRSSLAGAVLASVPLVSVLAMIWLYADTRDTAQVAALAKSIFWLVMPSLVLFMALPALLARGHAFYPSLAVAVGLTVACYFITISVVSHFGLETYP